MFERQEGLRSPWEFDRIRFLKDKRREDVMNRTLGVCCAILVKIDPDDEVHVNLASRLSLFGYGIDVQISKRRRLTRSHRPNYILSDSA